MDVECRERFCAFSYPRDEVIEVPGTSWFAILLLACLVVAVVMIRRRRALDRGGAFRSGSGSREQDQA